jgi:phage head maturation protease
VTAPLYDDIQPLRLQGYAACFDAVFYCPHPMRLLLDACDHRGLPVYCTFGHEPHMEFADQRDDSLRIWTDSYGVAFEADLTTWGCVSLAQGIRANNFRECSAHWDSGRWSTFADEPGLGQVETVKKAKLVEISIVPVAACPGTAAWLDDEDPADLPEHVAQLRARWQVGRVQAQLAARAARAARVQARARKAHQVPASVRAILAVGRPRGWIEAAEALSCGRRFR